MHLRLSVRASLTLLISVLYTSQWILNNELRFGQLRNCVQVTIHLSTYSVTQTFEQVRVIGTK